MHIQDSNDCPHHRKFRKFQIQGFSLVLECAFGGNIWADNYNVLMQKHFGIIMENCYWYRCADMDLYLNTSAMSFS